MTYNKFKYLALIIMITTSSCSKTANQEKDVESKEVHKHENENTVSLSVLQMKSIQIDFGKIEQKQLTSSLKANGILKVPNQNKASITPLYRGIVKDIFVQPGNSVRKGQKIATLANPDFISLQEEYLSLGAKVTYAEQEYNRQKEMNSQNAGALKNYQQSEAELSTFKARRSAIGKQLELLDIHPDRLSVENIQSVITVISPLDGVISKVLINIGSHADMATPLAEVVDNSQLHLDLYIYEKDLPKVKTGQTIHFTLTNNPGKEYDAEIYAVSNTFEDATKALTVHATVKGNKAGLIDGMSITALVSLENATVPALPTDAIVTYQGNDYIFVKTDSHSETEHHEENDGHTHDKEGHSHEEEKKETPTDSGFTFERIPVRKGTTDVGYSEITLLKEVPANVMVVTKGSFFLLAKMTNSGEHEH